MQTVQVQRKALAAAIAVVSFSSCAQSAWSEEKKAVQLEQVIVTAQKSEERLQDVPSTINAVSGDLLDRMVLTQFKDLGQVTAGVSFDMSSGRRASLNMRGIQTNPDGGFADGVGVYWNNINISSMMAFQRQFDIDRIEVVRGPQGTLQGATSPAGAIQIHTRMPYLNGFRANIEQSLTNIGGSSTDFGIDIPIIENELAMRIAGFYDDNPLNARRDITTGRDEKAKIRGGRFSLLYEPGDVFSAKLAYEYLEKFSDSGEVVEGPAQGANPALRASDRKAIGKYDGYYNVRDQLAALNLGWDLGRNQIAWDTGYFNSSLPSLYDNDPGNSQPAGNPATFTPSSLNPIVVTGERFTQEVRLTTQVTDWWESLLGLYYKSDKSRAVVLTESNNPALGLLGSTTDVPSHGETYAIFTHHKFQITDASQIEAGLRWQKVNQYNAQVTNTILLNGTATAHNVLHYPNGHLIATSVAVPDSQAHDADAEALTSSLKYSYTFSPDLMAYASYDSSFRPGGVTPSTTAGVQPQFLVYDSEKSQGLEVGVKSAWFDNRLRVNADVFYQEVSNGLYRSPNVRVNTSATQSTTIRVVYNADTVIRGAELEVDGLITDNWQVGSNISYVDAKYDNGQIPCTNAASATNAVGVISLCSSSGRAGTEPNWSMTANSSYTLPLGAVDAYANVLLKYQSFRTDDTLADSRVGGFATTNLYLGVRDKDKTWDASIWVKNLFDKEAQTMPPEFLAASTTYELARPNEPRTVGVTVKYNFGGSR